MPLGSKEPQAHREPLVPPVPKGQPEYKAAQAHKDPQGSQARKVPPEHKAAQEHKVQQALLDLPVPQVL